MQSVNRALDVLFLIAGCDQPVLPVTISVDLDLPRPTVYRILETLSKRGIIARVDRGFVSTPKLAALTLSDNMLQLADMVSPYLHRLVAATGETSGLHVRIGDTRRCVAEVEGYHGIRWARGVGFTAPVWSGAVGHVLLAGMGRDPFDELAERIDFRPLATNTVRNVEALRQRVEQTRIRGWGASTSETVEGASAIAAPVSDELGAAVGVLSLYAPADRFKDIQDLAPRLLAVAKEASDEWVQISSAGAAGSDRRDRSEREGS